MPENEMTFDKLSRLQDIFYEDRPLMTLANHNVLSLLDRLRGETEECREEITKCITAVGTEGLVDLCAQEIRQEISDLLLFVLAIAKCCGLTSSELLSDAIEKIARNTARYPAADFQDTSLSYDDQADNARSYDKRRGFTQDFYRIAA